MDAAWKAQVDGLENADESAEEDTEDEVVTGGAGGAAVGVSPHAGGNRARGRVGPPRMTPAMPAESVVRRGKGAPPPSPCPARHGRRDHAAQEPGGAAA